MNVEYLAGQIEFFTTNNKVFTGMRGNNSPEYETFAGLLIKAGNKDLIQLTGNKNPHVRLYACWALAKRFYPYMRVLMEKHLSDTATIEYQFEGIIIKDKVNSFLLTLLSPGGIDPFCKKLKEEEIGAFRFLITTQQIKISSPPAQRTPVQTSKSFYIASP